MSEQGLGQGLAQLRLAHARGAQEQEGADGPIRVLDPRPGAQDGVRHPLDRVVLAHHPPVEDFVEMQQLFALALQELRYRDARPPGHHLGDLVLAHVVTEERMLLLGGLALLTFQLLLELGELAVLQSRGLVQVVLVLRLLDLLLDGLDLLPELLDLVDALLLVLPVGLHLVEGVPEGGELLADLHEMLQSRLVRLLGEGRLLDLQLHDLPGDLVHLRGHGVHLGLDHGACFVHQIDGLVRQEPVGDVAVGEDGGRDQGFVPYLHAVEDLVAGLEAPQNRDGVLHAGLRHRHRLEPALQRRVLLDVLPILVQGGGADAVELAPGQHGLARR